MNKPVIIALRIVIVLSLAGTLLVQVGIMPQIWQDLDGTPFGLRGTFIALLVAGIATVQVSAICVWRLLSMVRRGSVFSHAAFGYVNVVIGSIATASALMFALAVMLAPGDVAPGVVGLICGASLIIAGVALVVFVLRLLLSQAVYLQTEATVLRTELDEVI